MNKPKKPLRGLFASTEAPVSTPPRPRTPTPQPRQDQPSRPTPSKTKLPPERVAPPPMPKIVPPVMIMEEAPDERIVEKVPSTIIVEDAPAEGIVEAMQPVMVEQNPAAERIMQVQYNFESMRAARDAWQEKDYAVFLRRLDAIQTEAFILKGKLLAEAKNRFYETNKLGWAEFCDSTLNMNYTTANQYIRVATEFDVTSHQRTDFGFEHFKALLPLPAEARMEFLNSSSPMSVKMIRSRVKEIISAQPANEHSSNLANASRHSGRLLKMLELVKQEITAHAEALESLNQTQRWQMTAACQNIAAHLNHLAQTLTFDPTMVPLHRSTATRAGAVATADGAATMQEMISNPEPTGSSH